MAQKSVLITGCSAGGIGDALAQQFHSRGLRVFASARNLSKIAHLKLLGMETVQLDVTNQSSVKQAMELVRKATGGTLDIMVNNAGTAYCCPVLEVDLQLARDQFNINFFGIISMVQVFSPLLLASHGTIINIGSVTSLIDGPYASMYGASKAGLNSVSHALRIELAPFEVKVMLVITGIIKTRILENTPRQLSETSMYLPIRHKVEKLMQKTQPASTAEDYAKIVVKNALKTKPPAMLYAGEGAFGVWLISCLALCFTCRIWDLITSGMAGLNDLKKIVAKSKEHVS